MAVDVVDIVDDLIINTIENKIVWKIVYESAYLLEFRFLKKTTEKKSIIYSLDVDLEKKTSVFNIKYGPIDGTFKYENIAHVKSLTDLSVWDLQHVIMSMYNKELLTYE